MGHGAVLAYELALQLGEASTEAPLALALFEGRHALRSPAALLSWLPEERRREVYGVAGVLHPAVVAAAGAAAPSLEAFTARLASIGDYDGQLDYVATFRPDEVSPATAAVVMSGRYTLPCHQGACEQQGVALCARTAGPPPSHATPASLRPAVPPTAGQASRVGAARRRPAVSPSLLAGARRSLHRGRRVCWADAAVPLQKDLFIFLVERMKKL